MSLSIRVISSPPGETVSEWNVFFPEEGGSIGRGFNADLRLGDAKREISAMHAIISKTSRGYQVMDNSTNGLFVNGMEKPLGKGNSTTLSDGDVMDIGGYRLLMSCFLPMQARAQPVMDKQTSPLFADDPFHLQEPESMPVRQIPVSQVVSVDTELVENDPFINDAPPQRAAVRDIVLNFNALDDDPWAESELSRQFIKAKPAAEGTFHPLTVNERSEYITDRQRIENALDLALGRFLEDISPQSVETILDDFSGTRFWRRKPDYWKMYKRYFRRQAANHDWKIKFQTYFHAALKLQHERKGEKL